MAESVSNFFRLVYEIENAPGSRLFMVYKTREQAEAKLKQLQQTMDIKNFEIIEME